MDCISKWIEVIPTRTNDAKVVVKFLRENILLDLVWLGLLLVIKVLTLLKSLLIPYWRGTL